MTSKAQTFEQFNEATLDNTIGDSNEVLTQGLLENTAEAITTKDFLHAGNFYIAGMDGMWEVWAEINETGDVRMHTYVAHWAERKYAEELKQQEELVQSSKGEAGAIYVIPPWEMAKLQFNNVVEPWMTEEQAEKAIYKVAPHFWLNKSKAPKI